MKRFNRLLAAMALAVMNASAPGAGEAAAQNAARTVDWNYSGEKFTDFVTVAEKAFGMRFFFREEWVSEIRMPDMGSRPALEDLLDKTLRSHLLYVNTDQQGNIVVTRGSPVTSLSSAQKIEQGEPIKNTGTEPAKPNNIRSENILYEIGSASEKGRSGTVTLTGHVTDQADGASMSGVTVFITELSRGAVTDGNGFYQVNLPRGDYNMRFSFLGMKEVSVYVRVHGGGRLDVGMSEDFIPIEGAVITARRNDMLRRLETGMEKVNISTMRLMPSTLGETDIFKNILMLPGVKSVGEASQGFNVRGGAADQNLILLYGAPLFNPSHFFGFFTSVNADVISDLNLYKGSIPARYGGRLSSVIDITARDGSTDEFGGKAGISPVSAQVLLDIPVVADRLSLLLSARSTYSDWLLRMVSDPTLKNSSASFYDVNGRLVWRKGEKEKIELSAYTSHDDFRLNTDTLYSYNNTIASLAWNRALGEKTDMTVSASTSLYNYDIESQSDPGKAFMLSYRLGFAGLKAGLVTTTDGKHSLTYGGELNIYGNKPGDLTPKGEQSLVMPASVENEQAPEGAVYFEDRYELSGRLSLSLGLRYSVFAPMGPDMVRLYDPNLPRSINTIYDTLFIQKGDFTRIYSGPEYRLSINYMTGNSGSLKLGYSRTRQFLHLLSNTTSVSPTDTWRLSGYYISPQVADQISAGYYQTIPWHTLEWSAEVYFKPIRNMIDFRGGTSLTMNETIEKDIVPVEGRAYGLELMIRKVSGKATWQVSYTYSRILLRSTTPYRSDQINSGQWFPASHDKPHDLGMTFNYSLTRRTNLAFSYTYTTGRPITYPVGMYQVGDQWLVHYSDRNKYRIPYYSRLDISASLKGNLRSDKFMNPLWTFSCYNLLGRDNVYSEYFIVSGNSIKAYRLSVFANAIPTVSYSFDF